MKTTTRGETLSAKVLGGFWLVHKRLVEKAKRDDDELVIADKDGNPVRVKARDL
ncbi:hypothetical protein [Spirosoma fluminis]